MIGGISRFCIGDMFCTSGMCGSCVCLVPLLFLVYVYVWRCLVGFVVLLFLFLILCVSRVLLVFV